MKKTMKISFLIMGVIVVIIITLMFTSKKNEVGNEKENEIPKDALIISENKKNVPEKLLKDKTFENIKIKNIDILAIGGTTTFKAKAENISNETIKDKTLVIIFKDNNETECGRTEYPLEKLQPKQTIDIDLCLTTDVSDIKDITIEWEENKNIIQEEQQN